MRLVALLLAFTLVGCASSRGHVGYCRVFEAHLPDGRILGLVTLPEPIEAQLREQLLPEMANGYICWYVAGDMLMAANRAGLGISGWRFRYIDGRWKLVDPLEEPPVLLELAPVH